MDSKVESQSSTPKNSGLNARIGSAYNVKKFSSESVLKYSVDLSFSDTTFYKGAITYNILENKIDLKPNKGQFDENTATEEGEFADALTDLNDIYTLPFFLQNESITTLEANDSIVRSRFTSGSSKATFEMATHPLTEIIQSVKMQKPGSIFHNSTITFDKYITVNRIPVSMRWDIFKEGKRVGEVKISRISYPKP